MKDTSPHQKTSQHKTSLVEQHASAGPDGIAIAPPSYGISSIDRTPTEDAPEPGQEQTAGVSIQMKTAVPLRTADAGSVPENRTGLPDALKAGIESLSGLTMDDVRVHYNSSRPAGLRALAYTQGADIHIGPGQERHLPHEAWHVVQQKQGRVEPTCMVSGIPANDDQQLEQEADVLGTRVVNLPFQTMTAGNNVAQGKTRPKKTGVDRFSERRGEHKTIQMNGYPHPLSKDTAYENIGVLNRLRQVNKNGTLRNILFEDLQQAQKIMTRYAGETETGEADKILLRSILATLELHKSGLWYQAVIKGNYEILGEEGKKLLEIMQEAYNRKEKLAKSYGLNQVELHAIECYTQPGKNKQGEPWYMGPDTKWAHYGNGWVALEAALARLPSLGDLGIELTTYRVVRTEDRTRKEKTGSGVDPTPSKLNELEPETNIIHGRDPIPPFNQYHYSSTGITYTSSHMTPGRTSLGVIAYTGKSGKYIGPFGVAHWSHDAGEVLYPPHMYTKYEGKSPKGWQEDEKTSVPVYHLREVDELEEDQRVVEDKDFRVQREKYGQLDARKMQIIMRIEEFVQQYGIDIFYEARKISNVHGEMMYLTSQELSKLYSFMLISQLEEWVKRCGSSIIATARKKRKIYGDIIYLNIRDLTSLFTAVEELL